MKKHQRRQVELNRAELMSAQAALDVFTAAEAVLGPHTTLREVTALLAVAMRGPISPRALDEVLGHRRRSIYAELVQLGQAAGDGKPARRFVEALPRRNLGRQPEFALTDRGWRAAWRIMGATEAAKEGHGEPPSVESSAPPISVSPAPPPPLPIPQVPIATTWDLTEPELYEPGPPRKPPTVRPLRIVASPEGVRVLRTFKFRTIPVRAVQIEGAAWLVAGDVCECLGRDTSAGAAKALRGIAYADRLVLVHTAVPQGFLGSQCRQVAAVSVAGLLKLAKWTQGDRARAFERWFDEKVLPKIKSDR